jgi:hypothetical protein
VLDVAHQCGHREQSDHLAHARRVHGLAQLGPARSPAIDQREEDRRDQARHARAREREGEGVHGEQEQRHEQQRQESPQRHRVDVRGAGDQRQDRVVRALSRIRPARPGVGEERVGRKRLARGLDAAHGRDVVERVRIEQQRRAQSPDHDAHHDHPAGQEGPRQEPAGMCGHGWTRRLDRGETKAQERQQPQAHPGVVVQEVRAEREHARGQEAEGERVGDAAGPLDLGIGEHEAQEHRARPQDQREHGAGDPHGHGQRCARGRRREQCRQAGAEREAPHVGRPAGALDERVNHGPTPRRSAAPTAIATAS